MKRSYMLLILILTVGIGSAFATNDNNGGGNEGTKIELTNVVATPVDSQVKIDFNLNVDLVAVVQTPTCGSGGNTGWVNSGVMEWLPDGTFGYSQHRTCVETICGFMPPFGGWQCITFTRTEIRPVPEIE